MVSRTTEKSFNIYNQVRGSGRRRVWEILSLCSFAVWNHQQTSNEGVRRYPSHSGSVSSSIGESTETGPMHHSKGHSHSSYSSQQQHYSHHQPTGGQYWTNYNNPRRSGPGHYSRGGYAGGNNEQHWTQKGNRYPSHRLMNNANSTYPAANQQSPPSQRRPTEHDPQSYYKSERQTVLWIDWRFVLENRGNGYAGPQQQHSSADYSSSHPSGPPADVSYASHLNTHNR